MTAPIVVAKRSTVSGTASCPAGKVVLGGGVMPAVDALRPGDGPGHDLQILASSPLLGAGGPARSAWAVTIRNTASTGSTPVTMMVTAICARLV